MCSTRISQGRNDGWGLLDVVVGLTLMTVILVGVMGTISVCLRAERESTAQIKSQLLVERVLEEIQASPFDTLLSFNGAFVNDGDHRADIQVSLVQPNLVKIQVDVTSQVFPEVTNRGVLLLADAES